MLLLMFILMVMFLLTFVIMIMLTLMLVLMIVLMIVIRLCLCLCLCPCLYLLSWLYLCLRCAYVFAYRGIRTREAAFGVLPRPKCTQLPIEAIYSSFHSIIIPILPVRTRLLIPKLICLPEISHCLFCLSKEVFVMCGLVQIRAQKQNIITIEIILLTQLIVCIFPLALPLARPNSGSTSRETVQSPQGVFESWNPSGGLLRSARPCRQDIHLKYLFTRLKPQEHPTDIQNICFIS